MRLLPWMLRRAIRRGSLTLIGPKGEVVRLGGEAPGPQITLRLTDPRLDWTIALNPELKAAEAFMDGTLQIEGGGPYELLELFLLNRRQIDRTPGQIFVHGLARSLRRFMQHNPLARARRNAGHHYDIGNDFYRLWLDADLQYSCGYFPTGTETLEEAQRLKQRHIAAKLGLAPGQRVLDIGCGWGGLALYLAQVAGVEVVGITLAEEQLALARSRAAAAGLSGQVRFELRDFRAMTGTFDRVVSVGMLEHVGITALNGYFVKVRDLLAPEGVALVHSISSRSPPGITSPFLRKYIFPGGYAPSLSEATLAVEKSGLWLLDAEIWRLHYAHTLRHWRERFMAVRGQAVAMHDERFARMWEFYLAACEGVFRHGSSHVFQLQLARERDAMPLTRDYIGVAEAALAAREAALPEAAATGREPVA